MSKAVLICLRSDISRPDFCREEDLIALSERLIPDNIQPRPPRLIRRDGVFLGIVNPHPTITIRGASLCLGQMIDPASDWWHPGADVPDGTYAIFRSDDRAVELVSDILATRTIWYVFQKDFFAASTSQRALVYFLRGFQPRPETTAWMLSSGTLGPDLSWDERIRGLPGDSRLVLDRAGWSLDLSKIPVEFQPDPGGDERHAANLRQALEDTMRAIDLDVSNWVLPLSGGYDSRALLLLSRKLRNMKAVTWGTRAALKDRDSDAWVGTRVARYFGMRHEYFEVDLSEEPLDKIVHRFLAAGEGRIDHITAYMDGFNLWKNLSESGCRGIVRGDEAFGCKPVQEAALIYQRFGLFILDDFPNLRPLRPSLAEMGQTRPARLDRRSGESLTTWADRMNAEVEIPVNFAALNDLKLSFVEIANPFLARRIVQAVRRLPDHLRKGKSLFRSIIEDLNPDLPFAKYRAIPWFGEVMRSRDFIDMVRNEIDSSEARRLFREDVVNFMLSGLSAAGGKKRRGPARRRAPLRLNYLFKRKILGRVPVDTRMNPVVFAFRAFIVLKMRKKLMEDSVAYAKIHKDSASASRPGRISRTG